MWKIGRISNRHGTTVFDIHIVPTHTHYEYIDFGGNESYELIAQ